MSDYHNHYRKSIEQPEAFWLEQAKNLDWFEFPPQGLTQNEQGFYRWFKGGKLNTSYLALDYHVLHGRAEQAALIWDSPVTGNKVAYTYRQLRDEVARLAGGLKKLGLNKGDTAIIYMPMIPQAAIAMLACARLGVIHSVVFGGFAAHELAIRIDDAQPKAIIAASGGIEITRKIEYKPIVDQALRESQHTPSQGVVMYRRPEVPCELEADRDHDWNDLMAKAEPADAEPVDAIDPLYILYTSGTTGKPKGIVRDHGGHATALKYSMKAVYDVDPGDVFWAASDVGWVVGHSYIVYAPLLQGCTTIMFEGKPIKTPDAGTFWRIIQEHKVKVLFTAPTAIRAIKKEDPHGHYKEEYATPSLKYLFLAGERCDVATYEWARDLLNVPVVDHWWQTESGWPMLANMAGYGLLPTKPGSATKPVCGYDIHILDPEGNQLGANQEGAVAIKLPLPPSCLLTLWRNNERFKAGYLNRYPGYYLAGDGGYIDEEGYVFITGRIDDVINVAGHRLSTAEMEEVVAMHPNVAECAVIGIEDELKGQVPVGFVVLKKVAQGDGQLGFMEINGTTETDDAELEKQLIRAVREQVGAVASFKRAIVVSRLPKTRSGKILRKVMRAMTDGKEFAMPSTIEDPVVLDELQLRLQEEKVGIAYAG